MHEKLVSLAVIPMPGRILGLDMMPYSLGCELQLFREDSPFLTMEYEQFNKLSFQKQTLALIRGVNICCKKSPRWFSLWSWIYKPRNAAQLALGVAEYRNYLSDGRLQFRASLAPSEGASLRYLGEPEILRLYRWIIKNVPRNEIEIWGKSAWDFPYSFAKMMTQGEAEELGGLEIYNYKKQFHDNYHQQSELGRAAWGECKTDDERKSALEKYPIIRELAGLVEEVAEFEKGALCQEL